MSLFARIRGLLFPPKCAACGALLDWCEAPRDGDALCPSCKKRWESEKLETCGHCSRRVSECSCMPDDLRKSGCLGLRKLTYYLHGTREPVQNLVIYHVKENRDLTTTAFLASDLLPVLEELLAKSGVAPQDAILTYVPRSAVAKAKYGTDQAELLARTLSRRSGIPCRNLLKRRRKASKEQKTLTLTERRKNADETFRARRDEKIEAKLLFLVDDIVTTGTSAAACVRILQRMGARNIYCVSVASDDVNR